MKNGFGRVVKAFFGIKIRFWALILACVLCVGVTYGLTVQRERGRIGSEENYSQAMKYLEIKNVIDEKYVGTVNEESVSAAAFDANGLGPGRPVELLHEPQRVQRLQALQREPVRGPRRPGGQGRGDRRAQDNRRQFRHPRRQRGPRGWGHHPRRGRHGHHRHDRRRRAQLHKLEPRRERKAENKGQGRQRVRAERQLRAHLHEPRHVPYAERLHRLCADT